MSMLKLYEQYGRVEQETPKPKKASTPADTPKCRHVLYVATTLDFWEMHDPERHARDVEIDGVMYRRLDPEYHAWLKRKMAEVEARVPSGRASGADLPGLRSRWSMVDAWAKGQLGSAALDAALLALDVARYVPPRKDASGTRCDAQVATRRPCGDDLGTVEGQSGYLFPADGEWKCSHPVGKDALAKVDAIRDQAISLGWTEAQLYQNRGALVFPCGHEYGLVCYLDGGQRIGEVTLQSIEIIGPPPRETISHFYNWEVDQPWMKRIAPKTTNPAK